MWLFAIKLFKRQEELLGKQNKIWILMAYPVFVGQIEIIQTIATLRSQLKVPAPFLSL